MVVDDEPDIADAHALRLEDRYETRVAYSGQEALDLLDDAVDAVLLDRRMPDLHGDEVLARIRERGYEMPVIMATAVDPDLNILEMDFDDYLCKPIFSETLAETVAKHLETPVRRNETVAEFISLVSKIDVLESERTPAELAESEEYRRAKERAEELGPVLRDRIEDFDELLATYRDIEDEP
jgi:DNA-binding response OmpR family regulator